MKCILKKLLDEKGWTQKKLATKTNIPQPIISSYARSAVNNYNIDYLFRIKKVLGLSCIDELFEE